MHQPLRAAPLYSVSVCRIHHLDPYTQQKYLQIIGGALLLFQNHVNYISVVTFGLIPLDNCY